MKKKIIIIISIILVFTGCDKGKMSSSSFIVEMTDKGFTVKNTLSEFPSDVLKEAYVAQKGNIKIEFYVANSITQAAYAYKFNKRIFLEDMSSDTTSYEKVKDDYAKYYYINDNDFKVISVISDTYIYVEGTKENSKEILSIIESLGY